MKQYAIHVRPRALREIAAVLTWWRINRPAAPKLIAKELRAMRKLLAKFPEAGEIDRGREGEIRRLLLRRSGYRVDHEARRVELLALWSAQRMPPSL